MSIKLNINHKFFLFKKKNYCFFKGCIRVKWQPKINQILVGLSDGTCRIYYDPESSIRGAKICVNRPIRRIRQSEVVCNDLILSRMFLNLFNSY